VAIQEIRAAEPRPLPVFVLADVSGSMAQDGKIDTMNLAMSDLFSALAEEQDTRGVIHVGIITFGGETAALHMPLSPASSVRWTEMTAQGRTPMGAAFTLLTHQLNDTSVIPVRAFEPTVVLVSDGLPTDSWEEALEEFKQSKHGQRALRMAMAIGADANEGQLEQFVGGPTPPVFHADGVHDIRRFFKWVTLSVTARSRSMNPNADPGVNIDDVIDF
jgi:uncharacterized protein YegL